MAQSTETTLVIVNPAQAAALRKIARGDMRVMVYKALIARLVRDGLAVRTESGAAITESGKQILDWLANNR